MDQLKKLGFTVGGAPALLNVTKSYDAEIADTIKKGGTYQPERQGHGDTFRDRLEKSLGEGGISKAAIERPVTPPRIDINMGAGKAEPRQGDKDKPGKQYLKNTHGEEFHTDNDKQVEKFVTEVEPIDRIHDTEHEDRKVMMTRSMTQDELFEKAMNGLVGLHENSVARPKKGEKKLVETKKEKPVKGLEKLHENSFGREKATDASQKKANDMLTEHADKSLDELCDLIKGKGDMTLGPKEGRVPVMRNHAGKPSGKAAPSAPRSTTKFLKAMGPGGMVFDFGPLTGNTMADNATALLQAHGDPQQMENARYQRESYNKSLKEYVEKGDAEHSHNTTPYGHINKETAANLSKSFDQQVQEAHDQGLLDQDPNTPAVKNHFNKSEVKLENGLNVKATSETDAALIEMMKAELAMSNQTEGGFVADARLGGRENIVANIG